MNVWQFRGFMGFLNGITSPISLFDVRGGNEGMQHWEIHVIKTRKRGSLVHAFLMNYRPPTQFNFKLSYNKSRWIKFWLMWENCGENDVAIWYYSRDGDIWETVDTVFRVFRYFMNLEKCNIHLYSESNVCKTFTFAEDVHPINFLFFCNRYMYREC